jgi:hypothetical protein
MCRFADESIWQTSHVGYFEHCKLKSDIRLVCVYLSLTPELIADLASNRSAMFFFVDFGLNYGKETMIVYRLI